ncbi:gamma-glutamyl-gamma-aminobutyrate hydrolase family protein [Streptomyces sp. NPDC005283]|uniref:type 1 glutamine amidotransferase n=1 Tax=Streptomyces sp. NPDC005283 TaxID=3156871 RepID=UPI003456F161
MPGETSALFRMSHVFTPRGTHLWIEWARYGVMSVLVVHHVAGEAPCAIATALESAGLRTRLCRVWEGDPLPESPHWVEALVVRGGPMSAYSDNGFPTRDAELALLRAALTTDVPVLGVCLGAPLLAVAAGGVARHGSGAQIGWGEISLSPSADEDPLFADLPKQLKVLTGTATPWTSGTGRHCSRRATDTPSRRSGWAAAPGALSSTSRSTALPSTPCDGVCRRGPCHSR